MTEILEHPFFNSINKEQIILKQITPEFIPKIDNDFDLNNFDKEITNQTLQMTKISDSGMSLIRRNQSLFKNFVNK